MNFSNYSTALDLLDYLGGMSQSYVSIHADRIQIKSQTLYARAMTEVAAWAKNRQTPGFSQSECQTRNKDTAKLLMAYWESNNMRRGERVM